MTPRFGILLIATLMLSAGCMPATQPHQTSAIAPITATPGLASTAPPPGVELEPREPWILFSWWTGDDPDRHIFLARPDGTGAHRVLSDLEGALASPTWSPDGRRFAFDRPSTAIWTALADGTDASLLTDGEGVCPDGVAHPTWSPDETAVAFICYPDPNGKQASVATFDLVTRQVTRLVTVNWPEHLDGAPTWSPDGASLAVAILHWDSTDTIIDGSLIAVISVAEREERRITAFNTNLSDPDWSPDGSTLVTFSYDIGNMHTTDHPSNLYAIDPDGANLRQITRSSVDGNRRIVQPRWSSDGTQIICVVATSTHLNLTADDLQIGFVDPAGGEPVLISPTLHGSQPDLRPT